MIKKLLSIWWFRILIFPFLTLFILFITSEFEFPDKNDEFFYINLCFSLLIASITIDFLRAGNYFLLFGLKYTKYSFYEIALSFIFNLIFFLLIVLLIFLNNDLNLKINNYLKSIMIIQFGIYLFIWAVVEEFIFRGILFQALIDKFGFYFSSFIISLIFSFFHIFNPYVNFISFLNTFLFSYLFCLMYFQTKSLYLPISFHFSWNLLSALLINSNISGYKLINGLFDYKYENLNHIIFGGQYGIEAGILTTIYSFLMIIIVLFNFQPHPFIQSRLFKREILESNF